MIAIIQTLADDTVPLHKRGDIVELRAAGSPVTKTERMHFLVIDDWVDNEWAAHLMLKGRSKVAYPYGQVNAEGNLALLSTRRADLTRLADFASVIDRTKEVIPKKQADLGTVATIAAPANTTPMKTREGVK